jgi:hypothetical protein
MGLLKSKRFWSAVIGLIAIVVTSFVPELQPHIDIIVPGILGIVGVLIGGYSVEDALRARNEPPG